MSDFKDYYEILGISLKATPDEITKAWKDKCWILSADRMIGAPETAKKRAEEELKTANNAYDILKDPQKRRTYDQQWHQIKDKPKPVVDNQIIRFNDVNRNEVKTVSFIIRNVGGPYNRINISNPNTWVKVVRWHSLTDTDELPLQVEIEATGEDFDKSYTEQIKVNLDNEVTYINVELQTRPQYTTASGTTSRTQTPSSGSGASSTQSSTSNSEGRPKSKKGLLISAGIFALAIIVVGVVLSNPKKTSIILPPTTTTTTQIYVPSKPTPIISINQLSGVPGSNLTVTGSGFNANESDINVTFDGTRVSTVYSANADGRWSCNFVIPASASGTHSIVAYGPITKTVLPIAFLSKAGICLRNTSGLPGSSITVTGTGFTANEANIYVTLDGNWIRMISSADANGGWSSTFIIPDLALGSHSIGVYGSVTKSVPSVTFLATTTPAITVTPTNTSMQPTAIPSTTSAPLVTTIAPTTTRTTIKTTGVKTINRATGIYNNYYLGLANTSDGDLSGDGCYDDTGDFIVLINTKNATNPTYSQLVDFLQNDKTDEYPYIYTALSAGFYYGTAESHVDLQNVQNIIDGTTQPKNPDVCADFAERLHNDAEMADIKCAYVSIGLSGYSDPNNFGISSDTGHALDAFQTTDRGLIYVDDTGWVADKPHPTRAVKTANPVVGQQYIASNLFPEVGWQSTAESMGTVTSLQVIWDGTWNN